MDSSDQDRVFERAAELFSLLSTRVRWRIVGELLDGDKSVGQLVGGVGASQPKLSQHLAHHLSQHLSHHPAVLYRSGLLSRRRAGSHRVYRTADDRRGMLAQRMAAGLEGLRSAGWAGDTRASPP